MFFIVCKYGSQIVMQATMLLQTHFRAGNVRAKLTTLSLTVQLLQVDLLTHRLLWLLYKYQYQCRHSQSNPRV